MNYNAKLLITELSEKISDETEREKAFEDLNMMLKTPVLEEAMTAALRVANDYVELPLSVKRLALAMIECWKIGAKHNRDRYNVDGRDYDAEIKDAKL